MAYVFTRTATVRNGAVFPRALQFATQIKELFKKDFELDLEVGMEMFGELRIVWVARFDELTQIEQVQAKMMRHTEYFAMLTTAQDVFIEGSLKDCLIRLTV
jgi:hypothetical protein